jgi:FkbM family methyltransferase
LTEGPSRPSRPSRPSDRLALWLFSKALAPWAVRLRRLPVVGGVVHALSHRFFPRGRRARLVVRSGLGRGLVLELDPRYEPRLARGDHEAEIQQRLGDLVRPGWRVWDIGSSLGFFTLILARLVGPTGSVVAFDPDPALVARLDRHVRLNRLENVDIEMVALWSTSGQVSFGIAAEDDDRIHGQVGKPGALVPATTLNELAHRLGPPQFVKIDVEGAEEEVLRGGLDLLRTHAPVVLCEVHPDRAAAPERLANVRSLLESCGYVAEHIDPGAGPPHLLARRP